MYCVLLDIPAFRQYAKTQPELSRTCYFEIQRNALDTGGHMYEIHSGRWAIMYRNTRPGDSLFMLDAFSRYEEILVQQAEYLMGYTILMEVITESTDAIEGLEAGLIQIQEQSGAFIGEVLASQLASFALLEKRGQVWKIQKRLTDHESPESAVLGKIERLLPAMQCAEKIQELAERGTGILYLDAERTCDIGTLVERALAKVLGKRNGRNMLWIRGIGHDDHPALALVRLIPPGLLESVGLGVSPDVKMLWDLKLQFLESPLQASWGKEHNRSRYRGMYFSMENLNRIWDTFLTAFERYCQTCKIPFIIYVENADQLPRQSVSLLVDSFERLYQGGFGPKVLVVSQADERFRALSWGSAREHMRIPRFPLTLGRGYGESSRSLSAPAFFDAGTLAMYNWLQERRFFTEEASGAFGVNEGRIHEGIFSNIESLDLEVYYLLVLAQGLLPLHKLTEFLISYGYERIRLPAIFARLHGYGLTRGEEQALAVYQHDPEQVGAFLSDSGRAVRDSFSQFILNSVAHGDTSISHDLFQIATEILDHQSFLTFTFPYAERLLDTMSFEECENVIGFLSARGGSIKDIAFKEEYLGTISYLNCRLLLLRGRIQELKGSIAHLEQLRGVSPLLSAYVALQLARWYYVLSDLDPALHLIKSAIMGFQERHEARGLGAAQVLIGLILLARERMVEARDYFVLARNTSSNCSLLHEEMRAAYFDVLVLSMQGYYSRVLGVIQDPHGISEMVGQHGMLEMACVLTIVKARIYFELGTYGQSTILFGEAAQALAGLSLHKLRSSALAWQKRSQFHQGKGGGEYLEDDGLDPELVYFESERLLREEKYGEVISLIRRLSLPIQYDGTHDDLASKNCFGLFDAILFAGKSKSITLQHLIETNLALALSGNGDHESAAVMMFEKTRSKNLSVADPYLYFYYYAYSRILRALGPNKFDDAATILGKSVKFFQERGSRIEDPSQKQQFFRQPHWNRQLLEDARSNNLA